MEIILPALFNFICLLLILYFAAKKSVVHLLKTRSENVGKEILEAEKAAKESRALLSQWEERRRAFEAHAKVLLDEAKESLQKQKESTLRRAAGDAERIHKDGTLMAESEVLKTKRRLNQEVVNRSIHLARQYFLEHLTDEDEHRLVTDYVDKLEVANGA